jgi:hypothetical protein
MALMMGLTTERRNAGRARDRLAGDWARLSDELTQRLETLQAIAGLVVDEFTIKPQSSGSTLSGGDEPPQKEDPWLERVRASACKRDEKPGVLSLVFKQSEVAATSYGQEATGQIADASGRVIGAFEDFALFKKSLKPIERRIEDRDLVYEPNSYLPEIGDDYGLFYRLLLSNMPLDRVGNVWSGKAQVLQKPRSTDPVRFHQNYIGKWHTVLGDAPSLVDLRSFTHEFLTTKCAPDKVARAKANPKQAYNDFKWNGFYMSRDEIDAATKLTIHQYGLARMKHGWEE